MDEENVLNFTAITSCDPEKAAQYLRLTDNNLEQAIQLFFDSPNLDLGGGSAQNPSTAQPSSSRNDPITIDSDEDMSDYNPAHQAQDDEAMARRLQEEMYGGVQAEDEVRAPMTRTTETLVGPGANWGDDADVNALVQEQLASRNRRGSRCNHTIDLDI